MIIDKYCTVKPCGIGHEFKLEGEYVFDNSIAIDAEYLKYYQDINYPCIYLLRFNDTDRFYLSYSIYSVAKLLPDNIEFCTVYPLKVFIGESIELLPKYMQDYCKFYNNYLYCTIHYKDHNFVSRLISHTLSAYRNLKGSNSSLDYYEAIADTPKLRPSVLPYISEEFNYSYIDHLELYSQLDFNDLNLTKLISTEGVPDFLTLSFYSNFVKRDNLLPFNFSDLYLKKCIETDSFDLLNPVIYEQSRKFL